MKDRKWKPNWRAAVLGAVAGVLGIATACAGAAGLMAAGVTAPEDMGYWAAGILVGAGLLAAIGVRIFGGSSADGAAAAALMLVVLLGLNGALNGGEVEGLHVTALALSGGCGAGLLLRTSRKGLRRRRRKRRKS